MGLTWGPRSRAKDDQYNLYIRCHARTCRAVARQRSTLSDPLGAARRSRGKPYVVTRHPCLFFLVAPVDTSCSLRPPQLTKACTWRFRQKAQTPSAGFCCGPRRLEGHNVKTADDHIFAHCSLSSAVRGGNRARGAENGRENRTRGLHAAENEMVLRGL